MKPPPGHVDTEAAHDDEDKPPWVVQEAPSRPWDCAVLLIPGPAPKEIYFDLARGLQQFFAFEGRSFTEQVDG